VRVSARRVAALSVVLLAFVVGVAAGADAPSARITHQLDSVQDGQAITDVTPPPDVSAKGWLVYDSAVGEPIAAHDASTARPIASLAKLMTAAVVLDRLQLDDTVTVPSSVNSLDADAAIAGLHPGEKWQARDLLRAMLVYSANDAALTLASHVSKGDIPAFVQLMNDKAEELGLDDSDFASPTGLDLAGTISTSTPVDLVALAEHDLADPTISSIVAMDSVTLTPPGGGAPIKLEHRNPLLGVYPGVDGVKTGYTEAAGYMLVVHYVDPEDAGSQITVATFASSSEQTRVSDATALLDWARTLRRPVRVVEGGEPIGSIPVQRSDKHVRVFACDDLTMTLRIGQRLAQRVVVPRSVAAPVHEGDEVGELRAQVVSTDPDADLPVARTVPICSADTVPRQDRLDRVRGYAKDYHRAWKLGFDEVQDAGSALRKLVA
jgi:D-alanyl-D-alanine carboxypeptidase (penicillin-binding protein 5/6)